MKRHPFALEVQKENRNFLHGIMDDIINQTAIYSACKGNAITSEIDPNIQVLSAPDNVGRILRRLLELITAVTNNSHIHISAKTYSDLVLVHFKEDNILDISLVFNELQQLLPEAEQLGGFVGITSQQFKFTTIAFTFSNSKEITRNYTDRLVSTIGGISGSTMSRP